MPQLIIANGDDVIVGTLRPYQYFAKYSAQGAPMAFMIQNGVPHCCIVNAEQFMTNWLKEIIRQRKPSAREALQPVHQETGWRLFLKLKQTDKKDSWAEATSEATDAMIRRSGQPEADGYIPAGWLPNRRLAEEWLRFVRNTHHQTTSLP